MFPKQLLCSDLFIFGSSGSKQVLVPRIIPGKHMTLECPLCHKPVQTGNFKKIPGTGGGFECPECKQMLRYGQRNAVFRRTLAVMLSLILVMFLGVQKVLFLVGGTLLLWAPMQLLVNAFSPCALFLKPWRPHSAKNPLWEPDVPQLFGGSSNRRTRSDTKRND